MRFEQLDFHDKIKLLQRIHRKINKELFGSSLQNIYLDIENLNKYDGQELIDGAFLTFPHKKISLSHEFVERIEKLKTQKEQVIHLFALILHESVHQYCYENGIDDKNHGGQWTEEAARHGLISIYENGKLKKESLTSTVGIIYCTFNIR